VLSFSIPWESQDYVFEVDEDPSSRGLFLVKAYIGGAYFHSTLNNNQPLQLSEIKDHIIRFAVKELVNAARTSTQ
jgi:hypothetical protein